MVVKLFGFLDLLGAIVFVLVQWDIGISLAYIVAGYLILKSLIFIGDFSSWIDLIAGIYLLLVVFDIHSLFSIIFVLWLGQKGVFSLFV
jgi:hypothetical protein